MATCSFCLADMLSARSCTIDALHLDGRRFELPPFGRGPGERSLGRRCGDCGVERGGHHHLGCDLQGCPRCRGQLLSCGCRFDEDGDLVDADDRDAEDLDLDLDDLDVLDVLDVMSGTGWVDLGAPHGVDANGLPTTRHTVNGLDVVIHHADIPASDITTVKGIRCTTALRTVIDIAPELDTADLQAVIADGLARRLFTVEEAWERLRQPDMRTYPGAELVRRLLTRAG